MIAGMTIANLFGVPLGTSLSTMLSWRATFLLVGIWGIVILYYIWRWVPHVEGLKDTGDMGAGHTVTAFYEVIPTGVKNEYVGKIDDLKYQKKEKVSVKPTGSNELLTVKLRYKAPDKDVSKKMELPFVDNKGNNVSSDFRFASAVAMFGQLLRESDFKGNASYDKVIDLAKQGLNNDDKGYRREFIRLVEAAKGLERTNKN